MALKPVKMWSRLDMDICRLAERTP
jgi:hypothetical protein